MKIFQQQKRKGYVFTVVSFSGKPSSLPAHPKFSDVIALISKGTPNEQIIVCESLEEIQILWDLLNNNGLLQNVSWGMMNKP